MIIGYARVSTEDQNLDGQIDALTAAGAERIFSDKITGTARSRPELDRLLDQLRQGDVITVTKYDRLARSLRDLLDIVDTIQAQGAGFRSLAEDIDTTTPAGRLVFHVFASIAQFERERISERTKEGRMRRLRPIDFGRFCWVTRLREDLHGLMEVLHGGWWGWVCRAV